MSRCSVTCVWRTYQEVRKYSRDNGIATLEEAKLKSAVEELPDWDLSAKEERMLKLICKYLGL